MSIVDTVWPWLLCLVIAVDFYVFSIITGLNMYTSFLIRSLNPRLLYFRFVLDTHSTHLLRP